MSLIFLFLTLRNVLFIMYMCTHVCICHVCVMYVFIIYLIYSTWMHINNNFVSIIGYPNIIKKKRLPLRMSEWQERRLAILSGTTLLRFLFFRQHLLLLNIRLDNKIQCNHRHDNPQPINHNTKVIKEEVKWFKWWQARLYINGLHIFTSRQEVRHDKANSCRKSEKRRL